MTNWQEIEHKLEILRQVDYDRNLFGASSHGYVVEKITLGQAMELAFRGWPQDYISLLLYVGSGPGPYYGIHNLDYSLSAAEERWLSKEKPDFDFETDEEFDRLMQEARARKNLCIPVCEFGCGESFILAVSGEDKGTLWFDTGFGDQSLEPVGRTFTEFYEDWLDTSLNSLGKSI